MKTLRETLLDQSTNSLFSSKVTRAGALINESKILLRHWDCDASIDLNLARLENENVLAKSSRQRVGHILMSFRQRCAQSEEQVGAIALMAKSDVSSAILEAILFFLTLRSDLLLRAVALEVLPRLRATGKQHVLPQDIEPMIHEWVAEGRTLERWSASTVHGIAVSALAALRDFGVLQGRDNKTWARCHLPLPAFAYIAFLLKREEPSGKKLIELIDWQIWNLAAEEVEANFVEAHARKLLDFQAAGSVIRLEFPTQREEEYARVIAQRAF